MRDRIKVLDEIRKQFVLSRPYGDFIPAVANLVRIPNIKTLLEDTSIEEQFSKETFTHIIDLLPIYTQDWRDAAEAALLAIILDPQTDEMDKLGPQQLQYASLTLQCSRCKRKYHYPTVLSHRCGSQSAVDDTEPLSVMHYVSPRWKAEDFTVCAYTKTRMLAMLDSLGLPDNTTQDEMDALGSLECTGCSTASARTVFLSWRSIPNHSCNHAQRRPFSRLSEADARCARPHIYDRNWGRLMACVLCRQIVFRADRHTHGDLQSVKPFSALSRSNILHVAVIQMKISPRVIWSSS